jgi:hypothetical protein
MFDVVPTIEADGQSAELQITAQLPPIETSGPKIRQEKD